MVKLKTTPHQLTLASSQIQDIYSSLEQEIFLMFVKRLKTKGVDADNIMRWQIEKLNELHLINDETIKLVSKATGIAQPALNDLFMSQGMSVYESTINNIQQAVNGSAVVNNTIDQVLKGYLDQTFLDLDNNVNQTLITTNYSNNPVMQTYQQIIKETTASVIAGSKTPERALADAIYRWRDKGITPVLIDKGGHEWSLEGYTRTVIDTTSNRAFQAVRNTAAADNGIDTFVMSSHAACRPACAPIQGKTVTTRSTGFTAPESGEWFEPLDNHGYKEPGGTFGINCHHMMWPYIPGVNTNNQEQFDPQESMERYKWQQKQRGLERKVRESKRNEDLANQLDDDVGRMKYGLDKRKYQSALRKLVDDHNFLVRDYSREKVYGWPDKAAINKYRLPNLDRAEISIGKISNYVLNPDHPTGGNKARVLKSALGFDQGNATEFTQAIYDGLRHAKAVKQKDLGFGTRYKVTMMVTGPNGKTKPIRTAWIKDKETGKMRLTTAFLDDRGDIGGNK